MQFRNLSDQEVKAVNSTEFASTNPAQNDTIELSPSTPDVIKFKTIDAPNNIIFDADKNRTISIPQTLTPDETNFVIKRDADEIKHFFGQEDTSGIVGLFKGVGGFAAQTPTVAGTLALDQVNVADESIVDMVKNPASIGSLNPFRTLSQLKDIALFSKSDEIRKGSEKLIERNKKYMEDSGLKRPEAGVYGQVGYDIGNGVGSMMAMLGFTALTRTPTAGLVLLGAVQKSQTYQEGQQKNEMLKAQGLPTKSASELSDISTADALLSTALEAVGFNALLKALKGNSAIKRVVQGFVIEGTQEGTQAVQNEILTQATGIRDKTLKATAEDVLYNGIIGGIVGGATGAIVNRSVKEEAVKGGLDEATATKLGEYAEANYSNAQKNMAEFIDKELAPIAADEKGAAEFMQLMKKFSNDQIVVEREQLTPEQQQYYDQYIDMFNKSTSDTTGVAGVEKTFYTKAKNAGVSEEQAVAASKLIGARADAASRALGISPQQWLQSHNLQVKGVQVNDETDNLLNNIRNGKNVTQPKGFKQPVLSYIKKLGGVKQGSNLEGELSALGITPKTNPGLFKKDKGLSDVDNIPASELKQAFKTDVAVKEVEGGYADKQFILDSIRNEKFGEAQGNEAIDTSQEDLAATLDDLGLDINTMSNEEIKQVLQEANSEQAVEEDLAQYLDDQILFQDGNAQLEQDKAAIKQAIQDSRIKDKKAAYRNALQGKLHYSEKAALDNDTVKLADKVAKEIQGNIDKTAIGDQNVIPGAERISDRQLAERKMNQPMRNSANQKPANEGLFGNEKNQNELFQSVYHGSPHRFDKFMLDHLGTGEGNQAFGWGLYFTGDKDIAEFYRTNLSNIKFTEKIKDVYDETSDPFEAEKELLASNELSVAQKELIVALKNDDWLGFDYPHQAVKALFKNPLNYDISPETKKALDKLGQVYEVTIPEDNVLLDFEKTLTEQSKEVQSGLASLGISDNRKLPEIKNAVVSVLVKKALAIDPNPRNVGLVVDNERALYDAALRDMERKGVNEDDSGVGDYVEEIAKDYLKILQERYDNKGEKIYKQLSEKLGGDKEASIALNEAGIKGNKYPAGTITGENQDAYNYVIFDDSAINILNTFYQKKGSTPRGSINFQQDKTVISLFKDANASTLFHELGHLFLRDMQAVADTTIRPLVKKDYETVKQWLGATGNTLTVNQEEKFARGFEKYLAEGKAPKAELQPIFDKFKEWLTAIYKNLRNLNVEINDDVRKVFDRMLGGDFVQTETLLQQEDKKNTAEHYDIIRNLDDKPTLGEDTAFLGRDFMDFGADTFVPISTRLNNIHPKLKFAVRRFVYNMGLTTHDDKTIVKPFIEKVSKMEIGDYRELDFALKNRDTNKTDAILEKYKLTKDYQKVRDILDKIYNEAQEVGLELGFIADYFPRQVRRNKAGQYLADMRNQPEWGAIQLALQNEDPDNQFDDQEKAEFVNKYLRGFTSNTINLAKPSFSKERMVDYVEPRFNKYYKDSMETLIDYIGQARTSIEGRRLFGKSEKKTNDTIGHYALSLVQQGIIKPEQENELKKILKAVVDPSGTKGIVNAAKNISYIYTMGSPISALTQIQDLAFSLAKNGYYRTGKGLIKSLTNNQILTKEDLGLDNVLQEFEGESRTSKAVRVVFKYVGLSSFDNVGKETYISAAYDRLRATNKKDGKAWNDLMGTIFGAEASQVKKDLADGTMSENVKYLLFSELSDVQPISLAEMPVNYLRSGNGRIFYMLKTYTIKQFDIYRNEIYSKIKTGDPKQVAEGIQNLTKLSMALMLMGMTTDALKDLVLGRPIEIDSLVMDNILKVMGFTKWQIYKSREDGFLTAFAQSIIPPVFAPVDDAVKDIKKIAEGKRDVKDSEFAQRVPLVGKFYYWWFGGGLEKIEKRKNSKTTTP